MSALLVGLAFSQSGPSTGSKVLMLAALADHANDEGEQCYPGVERLAMKCRVSVRQAQRTLRELESEGWITVQIRNGHKTNLYTVNVAKLRENPAPSGDASVTPEPERGDASVTPGVKSVSPKPSVEPSEDQELPAATQPSDDNDLGLLLQFGALPVAAVEVARQQERPRAPAANDLLGAYITWRKNRGADPPMGSICARLGAAIKQALAAGVSETTIKTALVAWDKEGQTPASLPAFIDSAARGGGKPRRARGQRKEKYITNPRDGIPYLNPDWEDDDGVQEAYITDPKTGFQYPNPKYKGRGA